MGENFIYLHESQYSYEYTKNISTEKFRDLCSQDSNYFYALLIVHKNPNWAVCTIRGEQYQLGAG